MMRRMFAIGRSARRLACVVAVLLVGAAGAASLPPPQPVRDLDLARYLGRWYVIAENSDDDDVASYFEFRRRDDGRIDALHVARAAFDRAPETDHALAQPDPAQPARWEVREHWFSRQDRIVLYVSADYRHALVGDANRRAMWVLAREPVIPEWVYAGLLARLAMQGFDVSTMRRVPQKP